MKRLGFLAVLSIFSCSVSSFAASPFTCGLDGSQDCGTKVQLKNDTIQKMQDAMALYPNTTMWMLDSTGTTCYQITNQSAGSNPIFVPNITSALVAAQNDFSKIVANEKSGCSPASALCVKAFPPAKCSITPPSAGKCGAASGSNFATAADLSASSSLCSGGTPSTMSFSGSGPWIWSCVGGASTDSSCTASMGAVNGICGAASGGVFADASALSLAALCSSGSPSTKNFSGTGPWNWTCNGLNGGSNSSNCFANGSCPAPYNYTRLTGAAMRDPINTVNPNAMFPLCWAPIFESYRCQPSLTANADGTYTYQMGMGCVQPICAKQAGTWTITAPSGVSCNLALDSGNVSFSNGAVQTFNWKINTGTDISKNFTASWSCIFHDLPTALKGVDSSDNITENRMLQFCNP